LFYRISELIKDPNADHGEDENIDLGDDNKKLTTLIFFFTGFNAVKFINLKVRQE
jgi:hypothetical protein